MDLATHLRNLNPEQYQAVTTLHGPLLILAGAGSGKTRVLTRRVAQLLHEGVSPNEVLAVTFTRKAAAEMKERVVELVGDVGKKIWVSTFHATCARILRRDIEVLGWTRNFSVYDDDDQLRMLKACVTETGYDPKRVNPAGLLNRIDWYKNRLKGVDDLLKEHRAHGMEALIRVWRAYEAALRTSDALDFNDLIGRTVELFRKHPAILTKWRERFRFIMVDEYQDTNHAQYVLLNLLASTHRNLAVVGDDDQSIYGFRGADISNILGFEGDFPDALTVRLEQNYRSSANILAVANSVVAKNEGRIEKKLWTDSISGALVQFLVADTPRKEAAQVANRISGLRRDGSSFGDMAIIYRTNATARFFEAALRENGIPHRVVGGRKFYERREVRDILAFLRLIINPADDAAFLRIVNVPTRGVGVMTLAKLREESSQRGEPLLRTARALGKSAAKGIQALLSILSELSQDATQLEPHELVENAIRISGYKAMLQADRVGDNAERISHDSKRRLLNLEELVRDARVGIEDIAPSGRAIDRITSWLDHITLAGSTDEVPEGGEVTLLTVHNAKGLEYPVVYVVQMMEGCFPHSKSAEEGIEEERRLAYVAFTRAMKHLFISRSKTMPSFGRVNAKVATPSRFLFGLPDAACTGSIPAAESTDNDQREPTETPSNLRYQAFMEMRKRHAAAQRSAVPEGHYTLVAVDSTAQLHKDARIHHEEFGFGVIRGRRPSSVEVDFGTGKNIRIPVSGASFSLVVE
jgi:DNA helicase-2/ATP-dependent DNA helicase PcrA